MDNSLLFCSCAELGFAVFCTVGRAHGGVYPLDDRVSLFPEDAKGVEIAFWLELALPATPGETCLKGGEVRKYQFHGSIGLHTNNNAHTAYGDI